MAGMRERHGARNRGGPRRHAECHGLGARSQRIANVAVRARGHLRGAVMAREAIARCRDLDPAVRGSRCVTVGARHGAVTGMEERRVAGGDASGRALRRLLVRHVDDPDGAERGIVPNCSRSQRGSRSLMGAPRMPGPERDFGIPSRGDVADDG